MIRSFPRHPGVLLAGIHSAGVDSGQKHAGMTVGTYHAGMTVGAYVEGRGLS